MTDTEEGMCARYGDILDEREDLATLQVVRRLEGYYRADAPWNSVPPSFDPTHGGDGGRPMPPETGRRCERTRAAASPFVKRADPAAVSHPRLARGRVRLRMSSALVAALALSSGLVLAATSILNLGKPTNNVSTNPRFPLSGFHYDRQLPAKGKPRIIFIGTLSQYDPQSAVERWPMIKALTQFGKFSGVKPADHYCRPDPAAQRDLCTIASYDWSHSSYRSTYVSFEHKDLVNRDPRTGSNVAYQRLNGSQLALYKRITHMDLRSHFQADPYNTLIAIARNAMPIVVVGKYIETLSQVLNYGDFMQQVLNGSVHNQPTPDTTQSQTYETGYSFQQIQAALITGRDPPLTSLNADVNGEANIITALICHADGGKPRAICSRAIIRKIQRSVPR